MSAKLARCYLYKGVTYNPAYTVDHNENVLGAVKLFSIMRVIAKFDRKMVTMHHK